MLHNLSRSPWRTCPFWEIMDNSDPHTLKCISFCFLFPLLFADFIFRAPIKLSKPGELREEYESQLRKVRYLA